MKNTEAADILQSAVSALRHGRGATARRKIREVCKALGVAPESWSLYSEDDGVVLFNTEDDAHKAKHSWLEVGANHVSGPFEHPES